MNSSLTYERFLGYITEAHAGQVDKAGKPYVEHLVRVADRTRDKIDNLPDGIISPEDRHEIILAALGHDLFEDTDRTESDVRAIGGSKDLVDRIQKLSRVDPKPVYQDWIAALAEDDDIGVILIKLSDNEDNNDPQRIASLPVSEQGITRRYERAHKTLSAGLDRHFDRAERLRP